MIDPAAFHFASFQAVTYYSNLQLQTSKVLSALLADLGDILSGDPITLPLPPQAPPEVPRVILSSQDQALRVEVALSRMDVRWSRPISGHEMSLDAFAGFTEQALTAFHRLVGATAGRVAMVVHRFQAHAEPGIALATHFCREELTSTDPARKGPLNRPENFELHAHKVFAMKRFRVNSWVRCKTGLLSGSELAQRVILVEQDLNTLAEALDKDSFNVSDAAEFFAACREEFESVLKLYFPQPQVRH